MSEIKYIVKCSSKEQIEKCIEKWLSIKQNTILEDVYEDFWYNVITYEEAKEKWLLGEKNDIELLWEEESYRDWICNKQETPSEESKIDIETIREELNIWDWIDVWEDEEWAYATRDEEYAKKDLKEVLQKHLSK